MKYANRPPVPIGWTKGAFVADDVPLGRPGDYYEAVRRTDALIDRLMRGRG